MVIISRSPSAHSDPTRVTYVEFEQLVCVRSMILASTNVTVLSQRPYGDLRLCLSIDFKRESHCKTIESKARAVMSSNLADEAPAAKP